jgi:hypothetical protein
MPEKKKGTVKLQFVFSILKLIALDAEKSYTFNIIAAEARYRGRTPPSAFDDTVILRETALTIFTEVLISSDSYDHRTSVPA